MAEAADALHDRLVAAGVDVLYDDRDVSPGVKFADADLLGVPVRLVVGSKGVARGIVEWRSRATGEEREAPWLHRWRRCWAPDRSAGRPAGAEGTAAGHGADRLVRVPRPGRALLYFSLCRSVGV